MTAGAERSGVLNLYKPSGPTSHDCVARVRRALHIRRAGHAGTLDPLATGVLLLGVGQGTRVLEYLQALPKTYRAAVVFGLVTDSQDTTGAVLQERTAGQLTEERVREALAGFTGEIQQVPPMHSALKVGGQRLYELARRGEVVEREARPITVYDLDLLTFQPGLRPTAEIRVCCSAGTYVRTLSHDLGQALGVGAAMTALEREAIGDFRVDTSVPLDAVAPDTPLTPLSEALQHLPALTVDAPTAMRLSQGQFVPIAADTEDGPLRVLDEMGDLVAIGVARGHGTQRLLAPEKVLKV